MSDIRVKQEAVGTAPIPATYKGATGTITLVGKRDFGTRQLDAVMVEYEVASGMGLVKSFVPLEDVKVLCVVDDKGEVDSVIGTDSIRARLATPQKGYVCAAEAATTDNEVQWPTKAKDLQNFDFDLIRRLFEDGPSADVFDCRCPPPPPPCRCP